MISVTRLGDLLHFGQLLKPVAVIIMHKLPTLVTLMMIPCSEEFSTVGQITIEGFTAVNPVKVKVKVDVKFKVSVVKCKHCNGILVGGL